MSLFGYLAGGGVMVAGASWGRSVLKSMISVNKDIVPQFASKFDDILNNTVNNKGLFMKSFVPGWGVFAAKKQWKDMFGYMKDWRAGEKSVVASMKPFFNRDTWGVVRRDIKEGLRGNKDYVSLYREARNMHRMTIEGFRGMAPGTSIDTMKSQYMDKMRSFGVSQNVMPKMQPHMEKFLNSSLQAEASARLMTTSLVSNMAVIGMPTMVSSVAAYAIGRSSINKARAKLRGLDV